MSRLIRVGYGELDLKKRVPQGAWLELGLDDINALRQMVKLAPETESKVNERRNQLDHARLSRMRRSVKKHKLIKARGHKLKRK